MKHWMAIAVIAVMATGLSLADGIRRGDAVITPGLPAGWASEGLVAGADEIGVQRPGHRGQADLVITRHRDPPAGKPLVVYQTIDATPWRGRTIVFSSDMRVELAPEVMRRTGEAGVAEQHIECDGREPASMASVLRGSRTRVWWENNVPLKVPMDATRCSFGVALLVSGEARLSRLQLKDRDEERAAWLAKRRPVPEFASQALPIFPAGAAAGAAAVAPPNLEFKQ